MNPLKHSGLALANALASGVNFILLFYFLRRRLKRVDAERIFRSFIKTIFASFIMGIIGWIILHGELWQINGRTLIKAFYLSGTIIICIGVYLFLSYLLKSEEIYYMIGTIKQRFRK
jgi:putative peptidoglycan lipid II flippase